MLRWRAAITKPPAAKGSVGICGKRFPTYVCNNGISVAHLRRLSCWPTLRWWFL